MNCPACMTPVAPNQTTCPQCGDPIGAPNPYAASEAPSEQYVDRSQEGDGTGGVIPYKNPKALIAYYLGILSGLPLIGLPMGVAAFVLGIQGLKERKKKPIIKGSVHAWIGIGCGGFFSVVWLLLSIVIVIALLAG